MNEVFYNYFEPTKYFHSIHIVSWLIKQVNKQMLICLSMFLLLFLFWSQVFLELMESEVPPESESSEKLIFSSPQEEEEEDDSEEEESKEAEETATINPLLPPALTGDVEGLQKIFEDPENSHHEQAMQLLLEEDIVGRNLLYAACMAGQSDVIRALAKYGVNLNEKTTRGILSFFSHHYYL